MKVDFNNLRRQLVNSYEQLVDKLNNSIILENDQWAMPNDVSHGHDINIQGYVLIDANDIKTMLNDMRMLIASVAGCSVDDDEDFKDIYQEMFPGNKRMAIFNKEEEE